MPKRNINRIEIKESKTTHIWRNGEMVRIDGVLWRAFHQIELRAFKSSELVRVGSSIEEIISKAKKYMLKVNVPGGYDFV